MASVAELIVRIRGDLGNLKGQLDDMQDRVKRANEGFTELGVGLSAASAAITAGLADAVKTTADFDAQMSKVAALSGATKTEFDQLRQSAIDLGAASTFSASEAAEGMQNLAAAGFNTRQTLEAMPGVLAAAAASGESFASVSDIMITAMNGFGLAAGDMGHIADVLAAGANASSISIADMGESIKYLAPTMKQIGGTLEQGAAAMAILGNAGIKGSMAGTSLQMALTRLASPSKTAAGLMAQLGIQATDASGKFKPMGELLGHLTEKFSGLSQAKRLDAASTIFGAEAMKSMLVLMDKGPQAFAAMEAQMKAANGTAAQMAKTMTDNLKGAMEQLGGAMESAKISVGSALTPALRVLADTITELVGRFNSLSPEAKSFVAIGAAVTAGITAIGGAAALLVAALPSLIAGWGALTVAVGAILSPAGLVVAAVGAAIAIFAQLYRENETLRSSIEMAWNSIKTAAGDVWPWIAETAKAAFETIKDIWTIVSPVLVAGFKAAFSTIANVVQTTMGVIKGVLQAGFAVVEGIVKTAAAVLRGDWAGAWEAMKAMVSGAAAGIKTAAVAAFSGIWQQAKIMGTFVLDAVAGMVKGVQDWMGAKLQAALAPANKAIQKVKDLFFGLYDAVVGHSYIPDLVDETGQHMARLDANLAKPAQVYTTAAAKAFEKLQKAVSKVVTDLNANLTEAAIEFEATSDSLGYMNDKIRAVEGALKGFLRAGLAESTAEVRAMREQLITLNYTMDHNKQLAEGYKATLQAMGEPARDLAALLKSDLAQALTKLKEAQDANIAKAALMGDAFNLTKANADLLAGALPKLTELLGANHPVVAQLTTQYGQLASQVNADAAAKAANEKATKDHAAAMQGWGAIIKDSLTSVGTVVESFGNKLDTGTKKAVKFGVEAGKSLVNIGVALSGDKQDWGAAAASGISLLTNSLLFAFDMLSGGGATIEEMRQSFMKAGKAALNGLSSVMQGFLSEKISFEDFGRNFEEGIKQAIEQAVSNAIVQGAVMSKLQLQMSSIIAGLQTGDFEGAKASIRAAAFEAKQTAAQVLPLLSEFKSILGETFTRDLSLSGGSGHSGYAGSITKEGLAAAKKMGIPLMADGGIVNKPTLAVIGEAGPEAVVPLGRGGGQGGGVTINVTIEGGTFMSDRDYDRLWDGLVSAGRRAGVRFA